MRYEFTKNLETGNLLIDSQHRDLFAAVNELMDACSQGKGREVMESKAKFLRDYVGKHFADEEKLQITTKYPNYPAHKAFHENYKRQLEDVQKKLMKEGPSIAVLGSFNQVVGILINHIRTEDSKLAQHAKNI